MLCWLGWIARIVQPTIGRVRVRMVVQVEDFHDAIPHRLTLPNLFYGNADTVRSLRTVELMNNRLEFVYMAHAAASSSSPTLSWVLSTPAAIAGVMRSVL